MSFTSKNLQSKRGGLGFIKGATLFFLGMSCVLFATKAFNITPIATLSKAYFTTLIFTASGNNTGITGIVLDGLSGNAYFAGQVDIGSTSTNYKFNVGGLGSFGDAMGNVIVGSAGGRAGIINYYSGGANNYIALCTSGGVCAFGDTNVVVNSQTHRVGIGTVSPAYKLDVNGTGSFNGLCLSGDCIATWPTGGGSSLWSTGGSSSINYNLGNVGIGTATPSAKLDVNGTSYFGNYMTLNGTLYFSTGAARNISVLSNDNSGDNLIITAGIGFGGIGGDLNLNGGRGDGGTGGDININAGMGRNGSIGGNTIINGGCVDASHVCISYSDVILANLGGKVGIGTATPIAKLQVVGTFIAGSNLNTAGGSNAVAMGYQTVASGNTSTALGTLSQAIGDYSTAMGYSTNAYGRNSTTMGEGTTAIGTNSIAMGQHNVGVTGAIFEIGIGTGSSNKNNAMTVLAINGNVGIGTTGPYAKLDVNGGIRAKMRTTDPCTDTTNYPRGTMFYNDVGATTGGYYCFCNGLLPAKKMDGTTLCF